MNDYYKNLMRIIAYSLALSGVFAGCVSERADVYADVKNVGPTVRTRYRYKIVAYKWKCPDVIQAYYQNPGLGNAKLDECRKEYERTVLNRYSSSFCRTQPSVFSDTGIPIVLREISNTATSDIFPTFPLSILSIFVFPAWIQRTTENVVAISVGNTDVQIEKFSVGMSLKTAMSAIIPSSLVFNDKCAECAKDAGYSSSSTVKDCIFFDNSRVSESDCVDRVMAYAVASKLKQLEDAGQIDMVIAQNTRNQDLGPAKSLQMPGSALAVQPQKPPYRIVSLIRDDNSDFAYAFVLEMNGEPSIQAFFGIQNVFAREVQCAYKSEYPNADISTLRIAVQPRFVNGRIEGRATVLTIAPVSLSYDAITRRGKLAVRFNIGQMEEARIWIRKNIETLAQDKNIALVTGQPPPAGVFYSLGEKIDGDVMEIEFKTE